MPCTPTFRCSQDEEFLYVAIRVPWVRVSNMEFVVDGREFSFFCKPYLLRLTLPGEVVDDERAKGVYDAGQDNGTVTVHLPKKERGEAFPNLDLLTKLLAPSKRSDPFNVGTAGSGGSGSDGNSSVVPNRPLIEVVSSTSALSRGEHSSDEDASSSEEGATEAAEPVDVRQRVPLEVGSSSEGDGAAVGASSGVGIALSSTPVRFGFHQRFSNFFAPLRSDYPELVRLPDPDNTPSALRATMQVVEEDSSFDKFRYMSDFLTVQDDPLFEQFHAFSLSRWIRSMNPPPQQTASTGAHIGDAGESSPTSGGSEVNFTVKERQAMQDLPNEEYLVESGSQEANQLLNGLLDILIAFAYDNRMTQGESNPESGWTIATLSSTLSWLVELPSQAETIRSSLRRILSFPYLRHWDCGQVAVQDAVQILSAGRRVILRCLLKIRDIIAHDEQRYLLNRLYIDCYCVWIQSPKLRDADLARYSTKASEAAQQMTRGAFGQIRGETLNDFEAEAIQLAEMSDDDDEHEQADLGPQLPTQLEVDGHEEDNSSSSRSSSSSSSSSSNNSDEESSSSDDDDAAQPPQASEASAGGQVGSSSVQSDENVTNATNATVDELRHGIAAMQVGEALTQGAAAGGSSGSSDDSFMKVVSVRRLQPEK